MVNPEMVGTVPVSLFDGIVLAYILTISTRFTVAPLVFTQRLRSRLLIRRIVFHRRFVNTHGATVNRGEIVSMYAWL